MAKKSFKDSLKNNPAMRFITVPQDDGDTDAANAEISKKAEVTKPEENAAAKEQETVTNTAVTETAVQTEPAEVPQVEPEVKKEEPAAAADKAEVPEKTAEQGTVHEDQPAIKEEPQTPASEKTAEQGSTGFSPKGKQFVVPNVPKGFKYVPDYKEIKSKRVQLVFPPSLANKIKSVAKRNNLSVNTLCISILEQAMAAAD